MVGGGRGNKHVKQGLDKEPGSWWLGGGAVTGKRRRLLLLLLLLPRIMMTWPVVLYAGTWSSAWSGVQAVARELVLRACRPHTHPHSLPNLPEVRAMPTGANLHVCGSLLLSLALKEGATARPLTLLAFASGVCVSVVPGPVWHRCALHLGAGRRPHGCKQQRRR